jgi:hypothetical protein
MPWIKKMCTHCMQPPHAPGTNLTPPVLREIKDSY